MLGPMSFVWICLVGLWWWWFRRRRRRRERRTTPLAPSSSFKCVAVRENCVAIPVRLDGLGPTTRVVALDDRYLRVQLADTADPAAALADLLEKTLLPRLAQPAKIATFRDGPTGLAATLTSAAADLALAVTCGRVLIDAAAAQQYCRS